MKPTFGCTRRATSTLLTIGLAAAGLFAVQAASPLATRAEAATVTDPTPTQAMNAVAQFQGVWTSPPTNLTSGETADAPLMGNGDVGVAVGGSIDNQTFYIGKNDFFSTATDSIEPLGRMVLALPGMSGASYNVVQNIAQAQVDGTYALNGDTVATTSWVSATEGMFVTSITLSGSTAQSATVTLQDGFGNTPTTSISGSVLNADVQAGTTSATNNPQAQMSATLLGGSASLSGNKMSITLQPGTTYTLATAIESSGDTSSYQSSAQSMASSLTTSSLSSLLSSHESWWQSYWQQSFVQIPDQAVEKSWYGSLYLLGSTSRSGKYAPGLWGNWILGNMNWNGDYHTNYNYEIPFDAALSTNHIAQMGSYDAPVLAYMSAGEALATANGDKGVLYPVGILPNGLTDGANSLLNQKSDAAYLASDMVMEFEYSRSATYAAKVLPYLEQVGTFWQNYLTVDSSGTYNIDNDAPQENDAYPQTNSAVTLALVHQVFQGLVDMSNALGENSSEISTWQNINTHLAAQPTTTQNGQTVFSETSQGAGFVNDGNDVDIQSVYPGSQVGLDSSATLLQEAQNTIGQLTSAWAGGNAPATFYAAAARVGYNASTIMTNLHDEATNQSYNNMAVHHNGGGIENINVTTSGLDEMLLQSYQNDVKVFPDWPSNSNAKFGDLLAYGDFLVSSGIQNNTVQYVQAVSQAGGNYTFTNPWPGQSIEYYNNGTDEGTLSGTQITVSTTAGETIDLAPAGTSLSTIQTELAATAQTSTSNTFSTSLESGQAQPTWTDTVDTTDAKGGGDTGVTGICCGASGPEAAVRTGEQSHTGSAALMYSGYANGGSATHAYMQAFDLSQAPLVVGPATTLSYWIFPQSNATSTWVPAGSKNSTCVAVDLILSDGSDLRDSGAADQNGIGMHPTAQCGHLTLDTWNYVSVNLGSVKSGLGIDKILVGYDDPGSTGGYRGYVDDLNIGFSRSLESGQAQPTWTDTVDTTDAKGGGDTGVTGICCGASGPEAAVRTGEQSHTGSAALMYSGYANGGAATHAYMQVFQLSATPLYVDSNTVLSYWIFPQSNATSTWVPSGSANSSCVAVDLLFADGSDLRDSGVTDQNGIGMHPADQCGHLTLDTWNHVTVNLGSVKAGLGITKILLGYDVPGSTGGYRGYVDDLSIGG